MKLEGSLALSLSSTIGAVLTWRVAALPDPTNCSLRYSCESPTAAEAVDCDTYEEVTFVLLFEPKHS